MLSPEAHLASVEAELALLAQRPLSARQARLVAALLEVMPDRVYAARRGEADSLLGAGDRAEFFDRVVALSPEMAAIAALGAGRARLETAAMPVDREAVSAMDVRDFMVSVYNDQTVPVLMLVGSNGSETPVAGVLSAAFAFWQERLRP